MRERGGQAAAEFDLEAFLPYELSVVSNRVSRTFARRYADAFGLSIPEWRVMAMVGRHAPLSSNQICERTAMDKAKVSRAVSRLIEAGHLARGTNPQDQRLIQLTFTAAGRRVYDAIVPLAQEIEAELMAAFEPGERETLRRLLRTLDARVSHLGTPAAADGED
ncbi:MULTISPECIES: MarR family winged helix-turn-helix transcriptional regulator [Inquilinus]|uniref:DNA-binding MarR family transcriptional regulator n=1 Tax=Inquilinus ginsengisoli TaxID=363840 RepID=A0ABU1K188_9PROT|nr:MarR family winged helix-turn-helix transcriptional regulator [Inquilinus ginsengisoli]MDR6293554.1 DNA-binding MarR family transcriptional regulator [Inquilinus ginsengisoli]